MLLLLDLGQQVAVHVRDGPRASGRLIARLVMLLRLEAPSVGGVGLLLALSGVVAAHGWRTGSLDRQRQRESWLVPLKFAGAEEASTELSCGHEFSRHECERSNTESLPPRFPRELSSVV